MSFVRQQLVNFRVDYVNKIINATLNLQQVRGVTQKLEPYFTGFKVEARPKNLEYVSHPLIYNGTDPAPKFLDHRVRSILKSLTGYDKEKVFRHRKLSKKGTVPKYTFLTDEQLKLAEEEAQKRAWSILQMPPVVKVSTTVGSVISKDPALDGLEDAKLVFTDISLNVSDKNRLIVVREKDGTLRHAHNEERLRMNQIYKPREGRTLNIPEMFTPKLLKDVLSRGCYEFVLDRVCVQLEPDDALFQSVALTTYDAVDNNSDYDKLWSTRHYGPLVFYLVWNNKFDAFLEHTIKCNRIDSAGEVVRLYTLLHPESKAALAIGETRDPLQMVQTYILEESQRSGSLQIAVKMYQERERNTEELKQKVTEAMGVTHSS